MSTAVCIDAWTVSILQKELEEYPHTHWHNDIYRISEIRPNLFLSDWTSAMDIKLLKEKGITAVLSVNWESEVKPEKQKEFADNKIAWQFLCVKDWFTVNMCPHYETSFDFIDHTREGRKVLVHCTAGVCRSPALVIHYLLKKLYQNSMMSEDIKDVGMLLSKTWTEQVRKFVHMKRPPAEPFTSWMKHLEEVEMGIRAKYLPN